MHCHSWRERPPPSIVSDVHLGQRPCSCHGLHSNSSLSNSLPRLGLLQPLLYSSQLHMPSLHKVHISITGLKLCALWMVHLRKHKHCSKAVATSAAEARCANSCVPPCYWCDQVWWLKTLAVYSRTLMKPYSRMQHPALVLCTGWHSIHSIACTAQHMQHSIYCTAYTAQHI